MEPSSTVAVVTVPETKFFEVAPSLKSVFDNTDDKPFSLFSSNNETSDQPMPRDEDDDDDDDDNDAEDASKTFITHIRVVVMAIFSVNLS